MGTRMKTLVLVLLATGCFNESDQVLPDAEVAGALPSDAHYIQIIPGYASPQQCLAEAEQPFICSYTLSLCKDGRAGSREGDLLYEGTYSMADSIAQITWSSGTNPSFTQFDVESVTELDAPAVHWVIDTDQLYNSLQFDNISCD
jgi:hypothetical protein